MNTLSARERLNQAIGELGIAAKKSLGQNFLVSDHVIDKIIEQVIAFKPQKLIEVGPGPGALTDKLIELKVPIQLLELDSVIADYWRKKNMNVLEVDALKHEWAEFYGAEKIVLVSNLPYQISSSIVIDRSLENPGLENMVLMFQKEVAQRIKAQARSDAYGLLSVIAQTFWFIETVVDAGPKDFDPAPKVASRVLAFTRQDNLITNRRGFLQFVKEAFAQRRKLLKSNLRTWMGSRRIEEQLLIDWLAKKGFKETARAEELSPKQFVELYEYFNHPR
ncbi:MAG: 16S rRNA (adenine(1518)-N(6)/adenine(1519)-N(6))-dimethyltransferase RsmA [Bdellovibrionia bacterium]